MSMPQSSGEQQLALPPAPQQGAPAPRRSPARLVAVVVGVVFGLLSASHRLPVVAGGGTFALFLVGFLLALGVGNALFAAVARPAGLAVVWAAFGGGRWAGSALVRGRLVSVRWLPLIPFVACLVIVDRPGLRRRLWCWTAVAVVGELAAGGVLAAVGSPPVAALGWGVVAMTALASFANPLTPGSRAWLLLRMPFRPEALTELVHEPALADVAAALSAGRVRAARAALDAAVRPDSPRHLWARAAVASAEGRHAEAADLAHTMYQESGLEQVRTVALSLYARALADGAAAGVWTREQILPGFTATLAGLRATRPAVVRYTDLGAIEAMLLRDDPVRAARLARFAAAMAPDALARAHALRTLAAALTWTGDSAPAGKALARATALSPR
ncbi:hypothetical protein [Actinacidiphila rubida]|uniref:hypothetical protein n=1 Tax=Actinacidiphila rubida TaxID=310780 RepID=UPI0009455C0E|nr:hypothetical protein [Actinacidiphila rubida]